MHANQSDAGRAITLMSESSAIRGADFNASVINEPVENKLIAATAEKPEIEVDNTIFGLTRGVCDTPIVSTACGLCK